MAYLINDWIELRSDAIKICVEMQRPIPWRADTIGPWLDNLAFLTWVGSITTAALVYLFTGKGVGTDGTPSGMQLGGLLLSVFFSEHLYLLVRAAVRIAFSKLDSPGMQKERGERFLVRKKYLEDSLGAEASIIAAPGGDSEKINRDSLEEEARRETQSDFKAEDRFWLRQRHWQETAKVGGGIIRKSAPSKEGKKVQ